MLGGTEVALLFMGARRKAGVEPQRTHCTVSDCAAATLSSVRQCCYGHSRVIAP